MAIGMKSGLSGRLRQLRRQNGWTLNQVSEMTALATSTLSKVENNQTSLTYDNLLKLAEGLGVDMAELFTTEEIRPISGRRTITRRGGTRLQSTPSYEYRYHATDLLHKRMAPMFVRVKARSIEEFGDLIRHSGEEFIYVLEGAIEVHTAFYEPVMLKAGESIYLDSTMGHAYISVGEGEATILGVCAGPGTGHADAVAAIATRNRQKKKGSRKSH
jgi:transcriptional regulator with XRE-family HTH domain